MNKSREQQLAETNASYNDALINDTAVKYFNSFGYDRWKYSLPDEYDSSLVIDKLVCVDPDKGAVLQVTRRRGASEGYIFSRNIRTVNGHFDLGRLDKDAYSAMNYRFSKECEKIEPQSRRVLRDLGL